MPQLKTSVRIQGTLKGQLIRRLRFSEILSLKEKDFAKLIHEVEESGVFQKLLYPKDTGPKAIHRRRFPHARLSPSFYEVKEELQPAQSRTDVEKILSQHKELIHLIKKIGQKNFESYFLYLEGPNSIEGIAKDCGITVEEVRKIQSLVTEISIHSEFFEPTQVTSEKIPYTTVARLDLEKDGSIFISWLSPHLAQGRYVINQERVKDLRKEMNSEEKKSLTQVLQKLEWINLRQDTLQKVLQELLLAQEGYFRSQNPLKLIPLTQRETSRKIGVASSTVCRLVGSKSVILPWGEEKPLKDLFFNRKSLALNHLRLILEKGSKEGSKRVSDEILRELMLRQTPFKISRRSINLYRRKILNEK